ncbi:unnamed protein product [Euphydryas editha]|uniref:TIR domain-containing protein n=1 Tax=Euphydryas editha TaxID=104508 RepID=A0AAU9UUM8_EUPED|nr:unnamed protein product [Euphydryas editha]
MSDSCGRSLVNTIEYVTFYGNNFGILDTDDDVYDVSLNATQNTEIYKDVTALRKQLALWSVGFQGFTFKKLKELDLRACSIQVIGDHTFRRMPELKAIYLGENNIHYIEANAFSSLPRLEHLDLSRNFPSVENEKSTEMVFESLDLFQNISLVSLDLSFTQIGHRNIDLLRGLQKSLKKLSICYSGLSNPLSTVFNFPQLKYLDVSGNIDILCHPIMFQGINDTLEVLYAEDVGLEDIEYFKDYYKLQILKVNRNAISYIPQDVAESLKSLQILDLSDNNMIYWFDKTFYLMKQLKLLNLRNNNINVITEQMFDDLKHLKYIGLSGNLLVCNCHARNIYEVALKNEHNINVALIDETSNQETNRIELFHTGFRDYNDIILHRNNMTTFCKRHENCNINFNSEVAADFLLLDYSDTSNSYDCLMMSQGITMAIFKYNNCKQESREIDMIHEARDNWKRFLLFLIPGITIPLMFFVYIFRRNLRYFIITVRNSATLSMINRMDTSTDDVIYNYDVFVSYCNDDRTWVLDQLLPHVERDCNISVCLHERDFQVGLSILENIVSCMDRSRSIMLIISKNFLLSQWCQFEMHLAQHRLLETRREDLILILLEEIPRRLRPNTLHYLMLTKTYIVWPSKESEQNLFWKRMKKSLITYKLKQKENISLA